MIEKLFSTITRVSRTDSTVLILGESGTGKELVASTIHYQSSRNKRPLIKVNCAALPDTLIESELFGHEKGAFTGAVARKPGRFELAHTGTIFLDEIGELPLSTQTKLLRVLEERSFERVGGTKTIDCDIRVLAATNRDLAQEVKKKNFRQDLFYRLNVIPLTLPPLRERQGDILMLIEHFTTVFNDRLGTRAHFSHRAISALSQYSFPGNVRELGNIVERTLTLAGSSIIDLKDLPSHVTGGSPVRATVQKLSHVTKEAEKAHIARMLAVTSGNRSKTAELLGISRKSLWEKIRAYNLAP